LARINLSRAEETSGLETDTDGQAGHKRKRVAPVLTDDSDSNDITLPVKEMCSLPKPPVPPSLHASRKLSASKTPVSSVRGECSTGSSHLSKTPAEENVATMTGKFSSLRL